MPMMSDFNLALLLQWKLVAIHIHTIDSGFRRTLRLPIKCEGVFYEIHYQRDDISL